MISAQAPRAQERSLRVTASARLVPLVPKLAALFLVRRLHLTGRGAYRVSAHVNILYTGPGTLVVLVRHRIAKKGYQWLLRCPGCRAEFRHLHVVRGALACRSCLGLDYVGNRYAGTPFVQAWRAIRQTNRQETNVATAAC